MPALPVKRTQTNTDLSAFRPVHDVIVRSDSSMPEHLDLGISTDGMPPDLTLLIFALPNGQVLELMKEIQSNQSFHGLATTILRVQSQEMARVLGLTKDSSGEVTLDIHPSPDQFEKPVEIGEFVLDPSSYRVSRAGKPAGFTRLEFWLLHYLAARPNCLFTRRQLVKAVFSGGRSVNPRIVDVYVRRIRAKLEPDPKHPIPLKTFRGVGYSFVLSSKKPANS